MDNTKLVVELAASYGAQVEAELGAMAREEYSSANRTEHDAEEACYTDPDLAAEFVRETGIHIIFPQRIVIVQNL